MEKVLKMQNAYATITKVVSLYDDQVEVMHTEYLQDGGVNCGYSQDYPGSFFYHSMYRVNSYYLNAGR